MKILYLITKSELGGAQTYVYQLAKYFSSQGNEIAVMGYPGGWLEDKMKEEKIEFYPNKYFTNNLNLFKHLKAIKKIKEVVKILKPDIVHSNCSMAGILSRLAVRNRIPCVFTAHGWAFTDGAPFLRKYLAILIEKFISRYCQKIICVSKFGKNLALKYRIAPKNKLVVIHNGVEIGNSLTSQKRTFEYQKIIFIGRLTEPKDPCLLLLAFSDLSPVLKEKSEIIIVGEGPKRKILEKFIQKNNLNNKIKLLGSIPRDKVFNLLKDSHIFVLTTNYEGLPYTILEAMSCGLAIIATDVNGVKEAVENCGFLVKKGSREEVKDCLKKLLENPELTQKIGRKCREKVIKKFSLEKMLKKTEEVYQNLILGHNPQKWDIDKV